LEPGRAAAEIKDMSVVVCHCVAIFEPWNYAESTHPTSKRIIEQVQKDFTNFFDVLVRSKDIARNGVKTMNDIAYTCSQLSRPTQPKEELEIFWGELLRPVDKADQDSKLIRSDFREARIRVIGLSNLMPSEVAHIEKERNTENAKIKSENQTLARRMQIISRVRTTAPAMIHLPFAVDLVTLVETRLVKKIEKRVLHAQRCDAALETLKKVTELLSQLENCITKFLMFWLRIGEMISSVRERISELRDLPKAWSIRLDLAKKEWEEAATAYRDYVVVIEYLCMIAPPVTPVTPSETLSRKRGLLH